MDIANLKRPELFQGLDDDQLTTIAGLLEEVRLNAGALVFEEDTVGDDLWLVESGLVRIEISLPGVGEPVAIAQVRPSEILGELVLIDGHRRSASARGSTDLVLYRIKRVDLWKALNADARLGFLVMNNLSRIIARRLRDTNLSLRSSLAQQRSALGALY